MLPHVNVKADNYPQKTYPLVDYSEAIRSRGFIRYSCHAH